MVCPVLPLACDKGTVFPPYPHGFCKPRKRVILKYPHGLSTIRTLIWKILKLHGQKEFHWLHNNFWDAHPVVMWMVFNLSIQKKDKKLGRLVFDQIIVLTSGYFLTSLHTPIYIYSYIYIHVCIFVKHCVTKKKFNIKIKDNI